MRVFITLCLAFLFAYIVGNGVTTELRKAIPAMRIDDVIMLISISMLCCLCLWLDSYPMNPTKE